jgi:bacteriocin-like protein
MIPPQKQGNDMSNEIRELNINELDAVSGGDMALDVAVKAYEALGKRLLDAVHQPVTQPTTLHF